MSNINFEEMDGGSTVRRKGAGTGTKVGFAAMGILLIGGLAAINWPKAPVTNDAAPTDDEFRTTAFEAPTLPQTPQPATPPVEQIVIPSPDEEAPAQAGNIEQTVQPGLDLDAQRRALEAQMEAEAARQRAAEEEALRQREAAEAARRALEEEARQKHLQERLASSQMVIDNSNETEGAGQNQVKVASDGQLIPVPGADADPNKAFLAQSEVSRNTASVAIINRRTDALVAEGTMIRGFLETAVNTDLPGMVRAVVREDVYSLDGRRVLIPKGSRLVGEYKSGLARGQKRVFMVWNRMIRSDGVSVRIGSPGTDSLGRAGMSGRIDTHWLERYGNAIMLSIVGGASEYLSSLADVDSGNDSETITRIDPVTGETTIIERGGQTSRQEARQIAIERSSRSMDQLAQEAFKDSQRIPPTIYVDQGTPIIVFLRRDLDFSNLYADPVQEELARLKQGGTRRPVINPIPIPMTSPNDNLFPPVPSGKVYK